MSENEMPTAEATAVADEEERQSYELAFHILPTVVEGEVPTVFEAVKTAVTNAGAELKEEETPQRFDLAYEIVKYVEGKNRSFHSAYFGWVRFKVEADKVAEIEEAIKENGSILRYIIVRLDRQEEENPFYFHEALAEAAQVEDIDEDELSEEKPEAEAEVAEETKDQEDAENEDETKEASSEEATESLEEVK